MTYEEFVASKRRRPKPSGFDVEIGYPWLFPFQRYVVSWAIRKGRACIFAGTGLGKTRMQLTVAKELADRGNSVLILAPLAVAGQTVEEGRGFGVQCSRDWREGQIVVINYDQLHNVERDFDAVILDESSILKSHDGAYRQYLTERFSATTYRFAFSATPAPNDYMELGTHCEFLGVCTRTEMLAEYFTHDGGDTSKWRLKRHARRDFWQWVSSWAMCFMHPRDIGFDAQGYDLPELVMHDHVVGESTSWGGLFGGVDEGVSATNIRSIQKETQSLRIAKTIEIESASDAPIILWCSTNDEHEELMRALPHAVGVRGSDSPQFKESALLGFARGEFKTLVTKPSIAGFGMNWQHCSRMVFTSISYSYESLYQSIRRCYRFGQEKPVHVHMIYGHNEDAIKTALDVKSGAHASMVDEMRRFAEVTR